MDSKNKCFRCADANDGEKQYWNDSNDACEPIGQVTANCAYYGGVAGECNVCEEGYWGVETSQGQWYYFSECKTMTPTGNDAISNCDVISMVYTDGEYICVKCDSGYYPGTGMYTCVQASTTV